MKSYTYIQNVDGRPLMPTTRGSRVRFLLKTGAARVVGIKPFTVRLNYETPDKTQQLVLGIDPGRTNIGLAVVNRDSGECVFAAEVETRNKDIAKLMEERKAHRQQRRHFGRRCKRQRRAKKHATVSHSAPIERTLPQTKEPIVCNTIINKEAKFCNRVREEDWLTPTANQLLQTHVNLVAKLEKLLPITNVALEVNKFAFMQLEKHGIKPWEYQRGPMHGFDSVESAVYAMQDGKCLMCGKPHIDHYHHVYTRHEHGSETLANRVGLCRDCHTLVHTSDDAKAKLRSLHGGMLKKYAGTSVLNQILPTLIKELESKYPDLVLTAGKDTADYRLLCGIEKTHSVDAYCIAMSAVDAEPRANDMLAHPYQIKQFRRHDRQVCHKAMLDRKYCMDGKHVATNRHKRFEQTGDSLEEFLQKNPFVRPEMLTVKEHKPVNKNMDRVSQGTLMREGKNVFVYKTGTPTRNGVPFYAIDTSDRRHKYKSCRPILKNRGFAICG